MKEEYPVCVCHSEADAKELYMDLVMEVRYDNFCYDWLEWDCSMKECMDNAISFGGYWVACEVLALSGENMGTIYTVMNNPIPIRAKWIKNEEMRRGDGHIYDYCCSHCRGFAGRGIYNNYDIKTPYCPHCGAKMDEK